jgi:hypothetical protein
MTKTKIDKAIWKKTLAYYHAWNETEFLENVCNARQKNLKQKWHEFLAIIEFGLKIKPQPSEHEQCQKVDMLNQYYERMQRFEARRHQRGKPSRTSST